MPKAFAIVSMTGGAPAIDAAAIALVGYTTCGYLPDMTYGLYLASGKSAVLTQLAALPNVYPIAVVTEPQGAPRCPELDEELTTARRNKLNGLLATLGYNNIPAGWTCGRALKAIMNRMQPAWTVEGTHVLAPVGG